MAKKVKKLEKIRNMVKELDIKYEEIDLSVLNKFVTITKRLDDSRVQYKVRHNMRNIVIITLLGILDNANTWNEIPMGPELIKQLNLSNSIITADALNTQKETVKAIIKSKGEYVLALKAN